MSYRTTSEAIRQIDRIANTYKVLQIPANTQYLSINTYCIYIYIYDLQASQGQGAQTPTATFRDHDAIECKNVKHRQVRFMWPSTTDGTSNHLRINNLTEETAKFRYGLPLTCNNGSRENSQPRKQLLVGNFLPLALGRSWLDHGFRL